MGNSIIDGLKSRLMQYLKHVVEDDVLFTKVISKFKPVTLRNVKLSDTKLYYIMWYYVKWYVRLWLIDTNTY